MHAHIVETPGFDLADPGLLGVKIGEGASADIHVWTPGRVVKLFKAGVRRRVAWHEARMTRAAFAAGVPAPEVFGEVTLDGRFGMVLERLDGPTLVRLSRSGAMTSDEAGAVLAALARSVHETPPPPDVVPLCDYMEAFLRFAGDRLPEPIAAGLLPMIDRLQPGDGLCHGDLHGGNVIVTAEAPKIVDWTGAVRAPAALDLAVCHMLLSELAPELVDDPERPRAVHAAMQAEYARLAGVSPAALTAAVEPYLPIACALALLGGAWPAGFHARLIRRLEAALVPRD